MEKPMDVRPMDGSRIALFDDHAAMRDALAALLRREAGIEVVALGQSGAEAVACAEAQLPDVIVLDINMPGDGIKTASRIFWSCPAVKIVMLTSFDDAHLVDTALAAGARAFIVKGTTAAEIARTLQDVKQGRSYISPSLATKLLEDRGVATPWGAASGNGAIELLEREEQVLRRLAQGLSYSEIGNSIGLSSNSAGAFATNILIKLHARTAVPGAAPAVNFP